MWSGEPGFPGGSLSIWLFFAIRIRGGSRNPGANAADHPAAELGKLKNIAAYQILAEIDRRFTGDTARHAQSQSPFRRKTPPDKTFTF